MQINEHTQELLSIELLLVNEVVFGVFNKLLDNLLEIGVLIINVDHIFEYNSTKLLLEITDLMWFEDMNYNLAKYWKVGIFEIVIMIEGGHEWYHILHKSCSVNFN